MREMKDSGIDIIGDIPNTYKIKRLKYLCSITTGDSDTQDNDPDGIFPFYVRSPIIEKSNHYTFEGTGILIAGDGVGAGKVVHFATGKYAVHQRVYRLYDFSKDINPIYLYYYIKNRFSEEIEKGSAKSTVDSIRLPMLLNFRIIVPSIKEQNLIVKKLKNKCLEIDSLITNINKQIDILEQYKKSVITETVTKGISKNVEMKDSTIYWIGYTPKNWKLKKIKYLFEINKVIAGKEGYQILSVTQKGIKPKDIFKNEGQIASDYKNYQIVKPGYFIMNHMDLLTGWVDISNYKGVTSPDYRVFKLIDNTENYSKYYLYIMQLCYFNRIFYGLGQGVSGFGRWRLPTSMFNKFLIPQPPINEQIEIANYLDTKCSKIDLIISEKQKQLETLEAYKKSLIYEYVTGKKEIVNE